MERRSRGRAFAALLAGALALPLAIGTGAEAATTVPSDGGGTGTAAVPQLSWGTCGQEFGGTSKPVFGTPGPSTLKYTCTYATVPLDYDAPGGPKIRVAMKRLGAAKPATKIGTIFVNPGGPGESGVDIASELWALLPQTTLDRFDVVGFDPRGIHRSTPLSCVTSLDQAEQLFDGVPVFPLDRTEFAQIDAADDEYTDLCDANGGPILDHMSTADVARDLDLLRRAVGDSKLTYIGYSYGTQLGNVYANMFPNNIRAMVLDGVLDPVSWTTGRTAEDSTLPFATRVGSDASSLDTLVEFFRLCRRAGPQKCTLMQQGDPQTVFDDTMADLHAYGSVMVDFGDGHPLEVTFQDLAEQTRNSFYGPYGWADLSYQISKIATAVRVAPPISRASTASLAAARTAAAVDAFDGEPIEASFAGFDAVSCSDSVNPTSRERWWDVGAAREYQKPYFGALWTWSSSACADWPADTSDRYMGPWTARTSAPVLVVGTTYDSATPYKGAQAVNQLLPGSRLLTVQGWGHTILGKSTCATNAVGSYLVNLTLPPVGATCGYDMVPFDDANWQA